jgi:hypothetical protein
MEEALGTALAEQRQLHKIELERMENDAQLRAQSASRAVATIEAVTPADSILAERGPLVRALELQCVSQLAHSHELVRVVTHNKSCP